MKCPVHPETDAVAYCGQCGRPLCPACRREVRGVSYCESCLAARMQPPFPPFLGSDGGPQPGLALFLGFIPGVGAIYNGQIMKAIVEVLIFGSLIAMSDHSGDGLSTLFGLGAAAFYFYMVIDSYQTARRKQLGQPTEEWLGFGDGRLNAPAGAIILIALGLIFLLDNMGIHVFNQISTYWPVLLIIIGVLLLQRKFSADQNRRANGSGAANKPNAPGSQESGHKEL